MALLACGAAHSKQLEWRAAIASFSGSAAVFTAVEAAPTGDTAFTCGHFEGNFGIGQVQPLDNPDGTDALVARFSLDTNWDAQWLAHARSNGQVFLRDLSIAPDGTLFVCGLFFTDVSFGDSGISFTSGAAPGGFVATLNPDTGEWINAFRTPGVEPVSIVALPAGGFVVGGPGALAARYDNSGEPRWTTPPPGAIDWSDGGHLAAEPGHAFAYSLTLQPDNSTQDVALSRIDLATGGIAWTRRMGGSSDDQPGGLDVAADGDVRLSFSTDTNQPSYAGNPIPDVPGNAATYTIAGRVRSDGSPAWLRAVGVPQSTTGALQTRDLDVDANGNAWLAATIDGNWQFETQLLDGTNTAAMIAVDGTGLVYDLLSQTGSADVDATAVGTADPDQVFLVGGYEGGSASFGPGITLPTTTDPEGFFAAVEASFGQALVTFYPDGDPTAPTLPEIRQALEDIGVQVYRTIDDIGISAWATEEQRAEIVATLAVVAELEATIRPTGSLADSGYALSWLNDPTQSFPGTFSYDYPDTGGEVVVHLIDTAIENPSGWFDANAKLTLGDTTLIRGAGDPTVSSAFEHGTRLLSLVAGPETGAALGTPVLVANYDIYPNGSTTSSALLADAILEASAVHLADFPCTPGLICIASSSAKGDTSAALSLAIADAVAAGLPVILSAGNDGEDAADFIPAAFGTTDGVICVGASDPGNAATALSNTGAAVDFFAPGEGVRTLDYPAPSSGNHDAVDGTSASAALVAGVAAIHLSVNPWQEPDALEAAVAATLHGGAVAVAQLSSAGPAFSLSFGDWADWHGISPTSVGSDSDGDGLADGFEYILGRDPCRHDAPPHTTFSHAAGTATFGFTLSAPLYNPADPKNLRDGSSWEVDSSTTLGAWSPASGSFGFGSASDSRVPVTLTDTPGVPKCFYRLEINHAP